MSSDHTRTPEEVRREIEVTREQLASTAAALAQKADVKARARERVEEVKHDVRARITGVKEQLTPGHGDGDSASAATAGTAGMAGTIPPEAREDGASAGLGARAASARHAAGEAAGAATHQVRAHPVPAAAIAAALLGFALGYLVARPS